MWWTNKKLKKLKTLLPSCLLKEALHGTFGTRRYQPWRNLLQQLKVMKKLSLTQKNCWAPKVLRLRSLESIGINKTTHWVSVDFKPCKDNTNNKVTKRRLPRAMASVYDLLEVASTMLPVAEQLYRTICDKKIDWDKLLPRDVERK